MCVCVCVCVCGCGCGCGCVCVYLSVCLSVFLCLHSVCACVRVCVVVGIVCAISECGIRVRHTSAYVVIRQHTSVRLVNVECVCVMLKNWLCCACGVCVCVCEYVFVCVFVCVFVFASKYVFLHTQKTTKNTHTLLSGTTGRSHFYGATHKYTSKKKLSHLIYTLTCTIRPHIYLIKKPSDLRKKLRQHLCRCTSKASKLSTVYSRKMLTSCSNATGRSH